MSVARQHKTGCKRKRSPVRIAHRFGDQDFQELLGGINKGLTIQRAAKATGFASSVVYDYLARNPDKQDALKRQCEVSWLSRLEGLANASGDWRAFAWLLERNFPHEFALFTVQRHQISALAFQVRDAPARHRLERAAEPPPALPRVLRDAALLPAIAREKHHDAIGLAELVGAQDQGVGGVEGHVDPEYLIPFIRLSPSS